MIKEIAWSVAPESEALNRPRRLVAELVKLGVVSPNVTYFHHGRSNSTAASRNIGRVAPSLSLDGNIKTAILSPVFWYSMKDSPDWVDYYDDWSLAPDINPVARMRARVSYSKVRSSRKITVNSRYMAMKLQLSLDSVVPNGVDTELAMVRHDGDERIRMLVLGKLFKGRADLDLIREMSSLNWIDEVVFCGIGEGSDLGGLIDEMSNLMGPKVRTISWIDPLDMGSLVGVNTFALIPHIVNDYTLSQNLMKAYLLSALGVPIVCPSMLWPFDLDPEYAFLINSGVDFDRNLRQWATRNGPGDDWRQKFVMENSWANRASEIAERIVR